MESQLISWIGWLGGILFAICGIPQAYTCWKDKNSYGLSWLFLITWFLGEVLTLTYILCKDVYDWPLIFNYTFNLLALLVIFYFKFFPSK